MMGINPTDACFYLCGNTMTSRDVSGPDSSTQAIFAIVGQSDTFTLRLYMLYEEDILVGNNGEQLTENLCTTTTGPNISSRHSSSSRGTSVTTVGGKKAP